MIRIQGIDHVAINVRDMEKAVAFYTRVLGLSITRREPSKPGIEYFLDCGPSLVGIIQAQNLENAHPFAHEGVGANHFAFRIHARDFDAMIERLHEHGAAIAFAKKREKSWSLYFCDIDGNKLEMTAWPREDGLPEEALQKLLYSPDDRRWKPY